MLMDLDETDVGRGLTLRHFQSATEGLERVSQDSLLLEAKTKMLLSDFSQLGVTNGGRTLAGVISWKSIARSGVNQPSAPVRRALAPAEVASLDTDLSVALPKIISDDFVITKNHNGTFAGIVTVADVADKYAELADPFLLCGQIDVSLRNLLRRHTRLSDLTPLLTARDEDKSVASFDHLSFGDYQRCLENGAIWDRVGLPLDRKLVVDYLNRVRVIRNKVMHFNPDELTRKERDTLKSFASVLADAGRGRGS